MFKLIVLVCLQREGEVFLPHLSAFSSDAFQQQVCTTACKKTHEIFNSDRKLKQTTDLQSLSCMNFPVSPKVTNKFVENLTGLTPGPAHRDASALHC